MTPTRYERAASSTRSGPRPWSLAIATVRLRATRANPAVCSASTFAAAGQARPPAAAQPGHEALGQGAPLAGVGQRDHDGAKGLVPQREPPGHVPFAVQHPYHRVEQRSVAVRPTDRLTPAGRRVHVTEEIELFLGELSDVAHQPGSREEDQGDRLIGLGNPADELAKVRSDRAGARSFMRPPRILSARSVTAASAGIVLPPRMMSYATVVSIP